MRYRIAHIRGSGKYAEFWFGDKYVDGSSWQECCKWYMLRRIVNGYDADNEEAYNEPDGDEPNDYGIPEQVMNHGYVGLWLTWPGGADCPTKIECDPPTVSDSCVPDDPTPGPRGGG